jgi:hypothetical protein
LDQYDTFLIKRFIDPEIALGQSFSQRVNDRMQMKPLKINDWFRIRQQFIQILGLLVHFSGGAPVRGSEILTVTFKNASIVQRGVFIEQGEKVVLLKTRYGKPSSMTGQDNPTIRVLSKRISQMLVHYLVIALPLYQYLMQK